METKTVKISDENYRLLVERSADLAKATGRPVSLDRALSAALKATPTSTKTLLDLALLRNEKDVQDTFTWVLKQRGKYPMREHAW